MPCNLPQGALCEIELAFCDCGNNYSHLLVPFLATAASAPGYRLAKTYNLDGEGGWDYLTLDGNFAITCRERNKEWGSVYRKPGTGTRILAFFLKIIPKKGPFRAVDFKIPTTQTEDMYIKSVDLTVEDYSRLLREVGDHSRHLPEIDFDTGRPTRPGEYLLADKTYEKRSMS